MPSSIRKVDLNEALFRLDHANEELSLSSTISPTSSPSGRRRRRYDSAKTTTRLDDDEEEEEDDDDYFNPGNDIDDDLSTDKSLSPRHSRRSSITTSSSIMLTGWDETIGDDPNSQAWHRTNAVPAKALTPHVMVHRSWAWGIGHDDDSHDDHVRGSTGNDHDSRHSNAPTSWRLSWKTSLAPHCIRQVASNEKGTVIAATTDNGTVSILRGRDGRVLATRRLHTLGNIAGGVSSNWINSASQVSFIATSPRNESSAKSCPHHHADALLVSTPVAEGPALLVSNIQGDRLNDEDSTVVTMATQAMNLHALDIPSIPATNIHCIRGYYHSDWTDVASEIGIKKIRFVLVHSGEGAVENDVDEAMLALAEYDLETQTCQLLTGNMKMPSGWEIDFHVGLHVRPARLPDDHVLAAFVAHSGSKSKICWVDPDSWVGMGQSSSQIRLVGEFPLTMSGEGNAFEDRSTSKLRSFPLDEKDGVPRRPRILTLEFAHSYRSDEAVAMTVGLQGPDQSEIQIVQAQLIRGSMSPGSTQPFHLGPSHILYRIPMPTLIHSISLCALPTKQYGPYSFRSKISTGLNRPEEVYIFQTASHDDSNDDGSAIGAIRLCTMKDAFTEARALVHQAGMEILLHDKFANFHPSEIVLKRIQNLLNECNVAGQDWDECLDGLRRGAGHERGREIILEAGDRVMNWPYLDDNDDAPLSQPQPTAAQIVSCLSTFLETLGSVSDCFIDDDVPSWLTAAYRKKLQCIEEKQDAIQYLLHLLETKIPPSGVANKVILKPQFSSVASVDNLFTCFVRSGQLTAAEQLWGSSQRSKLTSETLVASMLQIEPTIHPQKYANLLNDVILQRLSINHPLLPPILIWSCSMADQFDDLHEDGLDRSILFLEKIERSTNQLRLRVHSSFSFYSPFVERCTESSRGPRLANKASDMNFSDDFASVDLSFSSKTGPISSFESETQSSKTDRSSDGIYPNPTILELGQMKLGAQKASSGQITSLRVGSIDDNEECVDTKLRAARCLKLARSMGLSRTLTSLREFQHFGGSQNVTKELIRMYSCRSTTHEQRYERLVSDVRNFCDQTGSSYEEALMVYAKELCAGKNANPEAIEEGASLARCCLSPTSKCQVTLIALRAALFCRFSSQWLTTLSRDAIDWCAGDSSLRSELEEASRLLLIDGIVGRYCGNGAKELFHVDNPMHAIRLADFVAKHIDHDSVFSDLLDLCAAFHHLSVEDVCSGLVQNAILQGKQEKAESFLKELYDRDSLSGHNVFSRILQFCIDMIEDGSTNIGYFPVPGENNIRLALWTKEVEAVTICACNITKIGLDRISTVVSSQCQNNFSASYHDKPGLELLFRDFSRVRALQKDHGIYLSLASIRDPKSTVEVASQLLTDLAKSFDAGRSNTASAVATKTKRACSHLAGSIEESELLFASAVSSACNIAWKSNGLECFDFLSSLGILETPKNNIGARCSLAVALSYCLRSSKREGSKDLLDKMKGLVKASSLLQDYIISNCPDKILGVATSLSELCDLVSQVLARADEGVGEKIDRFRKELLEKAGEKRWSFDVANTATNDAVGGSLRLSKPLLHPTWYVGDGLLLPPEEALSKGIEYCKQSMGLRVMDDPLEGIQSFASNRGALSLALRILSHTTTSQACRRGDTITFDGLWEFTDRICVGLAERSLGGTGNGITSGVVDSQLAVAFLLCLPLKLAFKVYSSSLPTAINTRDFERVVTLATVGKVAGSKRSIMSPTGASLGNWTRQNKFVSQCESLAIKASWWKVLDMYNVNFDPHMFDHQTTVHDTASVDDASLAYAASLVPGLISNMAKKGEDSEKTLHMVTRFAVAFSLPRDFPTLLYIEHLLRPEDFTCDIVDGKANRGTCLSAEKATVSSLLRRLDSPSKRITILRKCIVRHEKHNECVNYELLSEVLSLYQAELSSILSRGDVSQYENTNNLHLEMELIDRRRDALAILSSYFQGDKRVARPSFSKFFHPLPTSIGGNSSGSHKVPHSRILGWESPPDADGSFDPLDPLNDTFRSSLGSATTSALAPLCIPLGVPSGYIRARSLISRFQKSKVEGASLPSFEKDVLLVVNQLRVASDIADLLEWCSLKYDSQNTDKMKCLDHALLYAIKASNQAEGKIELESCALARVKRITSTKDLLENRNEVNQILRTTGISCSRVLVKLMDRLESEVWSKSEFIPEVFVDALFTEASLVAADAALSEQESLSIGKFKHFSHLIHQVTKCIAEKYSHVQPGYLARRLTRRWLFYGDGQLGEHSKQDHEKMIPVISHTQPIPDIDEEDTMNFQMDLSIFKGGSNWESGIKMENSSSTTWRKEKLTSEEEPSSLNATSDRELSELSSHRSSLRIAFVMAYVDGYYQTHSGYSSQDERTNEENIKPSENFGPTSAKLKRRGLLSKIKSAKTKGQHDTVLEHCRELLRIVFAQPSSVDLVIKGLNSSFDSVSGNGSNRKSPSTITFAMRHRCFRTASILVPQEALEEVLREDEFPTYTSDASLKMCSFGSFVAKEVEEMGLPIPHSDLFQLSQMHFPSYGRTLWRHHRDTKGSKGRLLLLILEMYLKEPISDYTFFCCILKEMETLGLPRTLMLAYESISRYLNKISRNEITTFLEATSLEVHSGMNKLFRLVSADLKRSIESDGLDTDCGSAVKTLARLGNIILAFSKTSVKAQELLTSFTQIMVDTILALTTHDNRVGFQNVLQQVLCHLGDKNTQKMLIDRCTLLVTSNETGSSIIDCWVNESDDSFVFNLIQGERGIGD